MKKEIRIVNDEGFVERIIVLKENQKVPQAEVNGEYVDDPHYIIPRCPDGFCRPKWDFESNKWIEGKVFTQEELQEQLEQKIETIKAECEQKIISGFESDCLGEVKTFSSSMNNQATIQGLVLTAVMNLNGVTNEVVEHKAINEIDCYPWTNEQIIQLGIDLKSHITACKKEAEAKINDLINNPG